MTRTRWENERGTSAIGLISVLLAVAIGLYLTVTMLVPTMTGAGRGGAGGMTGRSAPGQPATPIQRAEAVECMTNLQQVKQAMTMYRSSNERMPANLQELSTYGVSASMLTCPVGGSSYAYGYDANTGRVGCRYPGHGKY